MSSEIEYMYLNISNQYLSKLGWDQQTSGALEGGGGHVELSMSMAKKGHLSLNSLLNVASKRLEPTMSPASLNLMSNLRNIFIKTI